MTAPSYGYAQDDAETDDADAVEEVVVTGYRGALINSIDAKRESTGFTDAIFADDLGKMPSQNLAESLNRVPGVKINREITGEGLKIAVRGLGPNFTKVTLNGNEIAIASDGALGEGARNREVDLGVFPTELFTSLSVSKSAEASQLEGGISGYVDMRTVRAFDSDERRIDFSFEESYTEINEEFSPKGSFIYSDLFMDDTLGLLVGVATTRNKSRVDGYETVNYTDGCLVDVDIPNPQTGIPQPGVYGCQSGMIGSNQTQWNPRATADYAATHPGVNVGDSIDVLAVAGTDAQTLDRTIVPRLGRPALIQGDRITNTGLVSLEYRPSDDMNFGVDFMSSQSDREFNRIDMMLWIRFTSNQANAPIVEDFVADPVGQFLRSATFYNSQPFIEARDYDEALDYTSVMPHFSWNITDTWAVDISANKSESEFEREEPTWLFTTPKGITTYELPEGNDVPSFSFTVPGSSFDLNGASSWVFGGGGSTSGARFSLNQKETETSGLHINVAWGEDPTRNGIEFGFSSDEVSMFMETLSADHNAAIAGVNLTEHLVPMSEDFGTDMNGSLGYNRFILLDYDSIRGAYDYQAMVASATRGGGDQFGQTVGDIEEEYTAFYIEGNKTFFDEKLRTSLGVRHSNTEQTLSSFANNQDQFTSSEYDELLPSLNAVYEFSDEIIFRGSASRTLTRPNPANMFPNAAFSTAGIDAVRAGNPFLEPFFSNNFDLGGEWYFDELGYVGLTLFRKKVEGFTFQSPVPVVFQDLPTYGVDISNLTLNQELLLLACGGPAVCETTVTTQLNVDGHTVLTGQEINYAQPLNFLVDGLGFNTSITFMDQDSNNPLAEVTGISDSIYSFTGYYENETFSFRMTYFHQDDAIASGFLDGNYDGDPLPARLRIAVERSQVDFAMSYELPFGGDDSDLTLTLDGYNLTNEPVGSWWGHEGLPENIYFPGASYTFGLRGSF